MKKALICFFIAVLPALASAQINAGNDTAMCDGAPVQLNAIVKGVAGTTSYSFKQIPYTPEPFAGTMATEAITNKPFNYCDDCLTDSISIGFTFCFLGKPHDYLYIASNGWVSFTKGQPTNYTSAAIPSTNASVPKDCIMGPWQDWAPDNGVGQVLYQTTGSQPNRKCVITWLGVPLFQCTANLGTFQVVLNETSNKIENYIQTKPPCTSWQGGTATQGVHDATGTIAYVVPGRNSVAWTASNEGWEFIPSGVTWYQGSTNIGVGNSITVSPTTTTSYIAEVTMCSGGKARDTVIVKIGAPITANFIASPPVVSLFDPICTFTDQTGGAVQWGWDFGDGNTSILQNPQNTYANEGEYPARLIACNSDGCCDTSTKTIMVRDEYTMYVPNSFSPNGDGLNDVFFVKATGIKKENFEMRVFTRWGQQVFVSQDPTDVWKGTLENMNEQIMQSTVFVYTLRFYDAKFGEEHKMMGHVNIIK